MKLLKGASIVVALILGVMTGTAQTATEIINKHLEAIGGKENLKKIKSLRLESTMNVMGSEVPGVTTVLDGKGFRSDAEFNGEKMVQVYTEKGGWSINPMTGSKEPAPMPDDQFKSGQEQIYVIALLDIEARGGKSELLGQEPIGDVNAYKVKITNRDSIATNYYFDPSTYYIVRVTKAVDMMGQPVDLKISFSDYRKTDGGWIIPQQIESNFGDQFSMSARVNKVDINVPVDEAIFRMGN